MVLDHHPCRFVLEADLDSLECRAKRLCPHKVGPLLQDDVQVALQNLAHMVMLEVLTEEVLPERVRVLVRLLAVMLGPVSIFN